MQHLFPPFHAAVLSLLLGSIAVAAERPMDRPDDRPASKAPRAWRGDQVQRISVTRRPVIADPAGLADAVPVVMAGDATGEPQDSPFTRVDDNSLASPYGGVCALLITRPDGSFMCSGAAISPRHVLSAAHCFDAFDDGTNDATNVTVIFNHAGNASHTVFNAGVAAVDIHPDYTGFGQPTLNDDLAIVTLVDPLPTDIPIYPPFRGILEGGTIITIVGYGNSGHGDVGVTVSGNQVIKRVGFNAAEQFLLDDEDGGVLEIWEADFDGPTEATNCFGGPSLGNHLETSVASGDSGGPSLVDVGGVLHAWGVNTFGESCAGGLFRFGGSSGGMVVNGYLPWIDLLVECAGNCHDCDGNGVADGIDLVLGDAVDDNGDGIPDACNTLAAGDIWGLAEGAEGFSFAAGGVVTTAATGFDNLLNARFGADGLLYIAGDGNPSPFTFDGGIWRFDPATGVLADRFIGPEDGVDRPFDMLFGDDGLVYVLNFGATTTTPGFITRHDPFTGDLVDVFVADDPDTPEAEHGDMMQPRRFEFGPDGHLYVAESNRLGLARFDGITGAFLGRFADDGPGAGGNAHLAFRDDMLWVARVNTGDLVRFDATSGAFIDTFIDAGDGPQGLFDFHWSADGDLHVLTGINDRRVERRDPVTGAWLETVLDDSIADDFFAFVFVPELATPASADVTGDGVIGVDDLIAIITAWGACPPGPCPEDLNGNGNVGVDDLVRVIVEWSV